jgi:putative SOS response-associated peptidase YedK
MCGRFTISAKSEQIRKEFKTAVSDSLTLEPRYNIAPSQMIGVVFEPEEERILSELKWGLVPSWSKEARAAKGLINARAETLVEKPSFREAFRKRRCIIPASGFYEWQKSGSGAKQPFYFYLKDKDVFGFAGLWEEWLDKQTGELLETCTIITTEANAVLKPVHDRMPVILKPDSYDLWLDKNLEDAGKLQELLMPYPAGEMSSHPVSRSVNTPETNSPDLITPINSL